MANVTQHFHYEQKYESCEFKELTNFLFKRVLRKQLFLLKCYEPFVLPVFTNDNNYFDAVNAPTFEANYTNFITLLTYLLEYKVSAFWTENKNRLIKLNCFQQATKQQNIVICRTLLSCSWIPRAIVAKNSSILRRFTSLGLYEKLKYKLFQVPLREKKFQPLFQRQNLLIK